MNKLILKINALSPRSQEQFYHLCQENTDLKLERNANGEITIVPPTGGETGKRNSSITAQLWLWNETIELGEVCDSSTGFILPNGANRSPNVFGIEKSRWNALIPKQREKFLPLCPDFVVEILSPSHSLKNTQFKMQEYIDNGCRF